MMRKIRKLDLWRGYACILATATLLAGCSSDLAGPGTESGRSTTGNRRIDAPEVDTCVESDSRFIRRHDAPPPETRIIC